MTKSKTTVQLIKLAGLPLSRRDLSQIGTALIKIHRAKHGRENDPPKIHQVEPTGEHLVFAWPETFQSEALAFICDHYQAKEALPGGQMNKGKSKPAVTPRKVVRRSRKRVQRPAPGPVFSSQNPRHSPK